MRKSWGRGHRVGQGFNHDALPGIGEQHQLPAVHESHAALDGLGLARDSRDCHLDALTLRGGEGGAPSHPVGDARIRPRRRADGCGLGGGETDGELLCAAPLVWCDA